MLSPSQRDSTQGSESDSQVRSTVRLLHRRRGWAWTAAGSLIGFVVYVAVGVRFFQNVTGTLAAVTVAVFFVLLALGVVGLIVVAVDTVRLHRADAAIRRSALSSASHHPLPAHAYRYPPRHRISWLFGWFMLALWMFLAVVFLPSLVNSVAYLAGASHKATFVPVSYGQACSRGGCSTVTEGYLAASGTHATWDSVVPLGRPFTVRAPVWAWGVGHNLINGTGSAIGILIGSLLIDGVAVLVLIAAVKVVQHVTLLRRQQAAQARGL
jgi:hypothetical protein